MIRPRRNGARRFFRARRGCWSTQNSSAGARELDVDFDPEFQKPTLESDLWVKARQASQLVAMSEVEKVLAPTKWQASSYPDHLCSRIRVIHEGIDTDLAKPSESASVQMPGMNGPIRCGDEILTFVARTLEPYRGYHTFMRALPRVLAERKNAQVIIVGGDVGGYGIQPPRGTMWKRKFVDEVKRSHRSIARPLCRRAAL